MSYSKLSPTGKRIYNHYLKSLAAQQKWDRINAEMRDEALETPLYEFVKRYQKFHPVYHCAFIWSRNTLTKPSWSIERAFDESDASRVAVHVLEPTLNELMDAVEKAERDLFSTIMIHDSTTWSMGGVK